MYQYVSPGLELVRHSLCGIIQADVAILVRLQAAFKAHVVEA